MSQDTIEGLAWVGVVLAIVGVFWLLARDNRWARRRTVADFERDVQNSKGSLAPAGARGLEKILSDNKRAAIEYRQDDQRGTTRTGSKGDDLDRTAEGADGQS